ncbi:MAG TPA: hypothetical protein VL899_09365 [Alphaproteobacteria bacterium]|jgi:hypothetical protein|nr:hypothetical protein [Alphaproteobacteria bacterium]
MRNFGWIRTYITIGITLGVILAVPAWQTILAGQTMPHSWPEAKPLALSLALATGHGVLRMYSWLPSAIYHLGFAKMTFQQWLFAGW